MTYIEQLEEYEKNLKLSCAMNCPACNGHGGIKWAGGTDGRNYHFETCFECKGERVVTNDREVSIKMHDYIISF